MWFLDLPQPQFYISLDHSPGANLRAFLSPAVQHSMHSHSGIGNAISIKPNRPGTKPRARVSFFHRTQEAIDLSGLWSADEVAGIVEGRPASSQGTDSTPDGEIVCAVACQYNFAQTLPMADQHVTTAGYVDTRCCASGGRHQHVRYRCSRSYRPRMPNTGRHAAHISLIARRGVGCSDAKH